MAEPTDGERELPKIMDVVNAVAADLQANLGGYALVGVAYHALLVPAALIGMTFLALGLAPGVINDDEQLLIAGYAVGVLGFVVILAGVTIPLQAGLYRTMWANVIDGEPLTFGAILANAPRDLPRVYAVEILLAFLVLLGVPFCYVGAIAVGIVTQFAFPAVIVHELGPLAAIGQSFRFVRSNPGFSAGYFAVGLVAGLIMGNIPLSGIVILPALVSFQLRCYRAIFGDGVGPREISG